MVEYCLLQKRGVYSMSLPDIRLHEGELNVMELLWSNYWLGEEYYLYSN